MYSKVNFVYKDMKYKDISSINQSINNIICGTMRNVTLNFERRRDIYRALSPQNNRCTNAQKNIIKSFCYLIHPLFVVF